jgi:hypothetical protein
MTCVVAVCSCGEALDHLLNSLVPSHADSLLWDTSSSALLCVPWVEGSHEWSVCLPQGACPLA